MMKKVMSLVSSMLKIGCIGFGGGSALIPVIEEEIVEHSKVITEEELNNDIVIASITPGALPVEIATGVGRQAAGVPGMILAATAMALPGAFFMILFQILMQNAGTGIRTQINYLAVGVSIFIILTLLLYVSGTLQDAKNKKESFLYLCMILAVFFLSSEKNLYRLLELDMKPVFALSTMQILWMAFFVILFTKGKLRDVKRSSIAVVIAGAYALSAGNSPLFPKKIQSAVFILMIFLAILGFGQAISESKRKKDFPKKRLLESLGGWACFLVVLSLPAILFSFQTIPFLCRGFLSSIVSFGGGDAYLSVAQGLFVEEGLVSHSAFFGNVVSVANALPGSILCKVLTGVGYNVGIATNGSLWCGIAMAVAGFACSVAASGLIFELIFCIYEKYESLLIFATVKHFIRPIISGLLLSVAVSLYDTGVKSQAVNVIGGNVSLIWLSIAILAINLYLIYGKKNVHLIWKILCSAGCSFLICNLLSI